MLDGLHVLIKLFNLFLYNNPFYLIYDLAPLSSLARLNKDDKGVMYFTVDILQTIIIIKSVS